MCLTSTGGETGVAAHARVVSLAASDDAAPGSDGTNLALNVEDFAFASGRGVALGLSPVSSVCSVEDAGWCGGRVQESFATLGRGNCGFVLMGISTASGSCRP